MKIGISRAAFDLIRAHVDGNAAEEVCGLLIGNAGRVETALPAENIAADRARAFELDPAVLLRAYRAARAGGSMVLGHYHSHPAGNALPSAADAENAVPGQLWLILADGQAELFEARRDGMIHGCFVAVEYEHC